MRTHIIYTIFGKEIREVLRDRRMLYLVILMPFFLYPVLFTVIGKVGAGQQEKLATERVDLLLSPSAAQTPIHQLLSQDTTLNVVLQDFDRAMLDTLRNTIGVSVPSDYQAQLADNGSAGITIYSDQSKDLLASRTRSIAASLQALNQQLVQQRLQAAQIKPDFIQPLAIQTEDLASQEQQMGKVIGGFLPMMILLFIFIGCIYIAIDITAGEKERRTLQTLYSTTANKGEIIAGKFMAVASVGIVSAAMNLLSLLVAMQIQISLMGAELNTFSLSISPSGWAWLVLMVLLSTVFLGALSLAVVLLANSYKEAQSYVSPLMMLVLLPAIMSQMPGMELNYTTAMVPMLNIALAIAAVVKGTVDPALMATVAAFALALAVVALWLASRTFGNESVVTGEKVNWKKLLRN